MAKSPTQRTLEALRADGILCDVSERWLSIPHHPAKGVRKDLFGFIDLVALINGRIVGIQCCVGSGHAARRTKIITECADKACEWLRCGGRIEIWSWTKYDKPVNRKRWRPRVEPLSLRS